MNKKTIVASLSKIANELDNNGLYNEANQVTNVMNKIAQSPAGGIIKDLSKLVPSLEGIAGPVIDAVNFMNPIEKGRQLATQIKKKDGYMPSIAVPGLSKYIGQSLADIAAFEMRVNEAKRGKPLMENQNPGSIDLVSKSLDASINALNTLASSFDAKMNYVKGVDPFGLALVGNKIPNSAWNNVVRVTNSMSELAGQFASFVVLQRRVYQKAAEFYPGVVNYLSKLDQTLSDFRLFTPSTEKYNK